MERDQEKICSARGWDPGFLFFGYFKVARSLKLTGNSYGLLFISRLEKCGNCRYMIYKMHKNVKLCRMQKIRSFQLIHTQSIKKRGKLKISKKLSTLSTLKNPFYVNYLAAKKNECFGEIWWNSDFVEKKRKKCWLLSSQKSDFKGCTILKICFKKYIFCGWLIINLGL